MNTSKKQSVWSKKAGFPAVPRFLLALVALPWMCGVAAAPATSSTNAPLASTNTASKSSSAQALPAPKPTVPKTTNSTPTAAVAKPIAIAAPPAAAAPAAKPTRGFTYAHEVMQVPWSIHVVKIELGHKWLDIDTTMGRGTSFGMSVISSQIKGIPPEAGTPLAAINGDFYHMSRLYPGDPMGLQICRGELVSGPSEDRSCFWIDAQEHPHRTNVQAAFQIKWSDGNTIPFGLNEDRYAQGAVLYTSAIGPSTRTSGGQELVLERDANSTWLPLRVGQSYRAKVKEVRMAGNTRITPDTMVLSIGPLLISKIPPMTNGTVLTISTATIPDLAGAKTGIGGAPGLVHRGKVIAQNDSHGRHPRSAIGWNANYLFMVVVDGRQPGLSMGMTLTELGNYLVKLGCEEGLNLDGGGSTSLWVVGTVINNPSQGYERPAANTLVLLRRKEAKP